MSDSRSIGSLIVKLVAQGVAAYKAAVDAAAGATDKAANAAKRLDGELASQTKQVKAADSAMQMLASSGKAVASALVAWKVVETVGKLVSVQREFDVLNSSLITVTGSSARAAQEFDWIKRFAATTPYQLNEVTGAFVKMKALGLDASEKALTSYGNTASAMGKGLNQMIEAVADASTGEFERLKEFGIRASKQGDQVSLTFKGVTTTVGDSANEITAYLQKLGNVDFAGAMATRAATLDGAISNLADSWDALFLTVSQSNVGGLIFDTVTLASGAIADATTIIKGMSGAAAENARDTGAMATIQGGLANVFETVAVLGANVKYVLVQVGTELGGLAAQAVQILQGNFAGAAAIRQSMIAEGEAARKDIDATTERILGARNAAKELASWNTRNASANSDPRRLDGVVQATDAVTSAVKKLSEAEKKAAKDREDQIAKATKSAQDLANIRNKEYDDIKAYMQGESNRLADVARASEESVQAAQDEFDNHGKLKSAIAETTLTRLEDQLVTKTAGSEAYESLQRQINAQKQLIGIMQRTEVRDASEAGAKDLADANRKAAEESSKYWEDALMRAFESGKGFFESLWDTIKNTLKTQVLKVLVTGTLTGLGLTGAAGAAGSVASSAGGSFLGNAASSFMGGSLLASPAAYGAAIGTTSVGVGSQAALLAAQTGEFGAAGLTATASAAGGTSGALAAALPYIGWAVAAFAVLSSLEGGETRSGAQYGTTAGIGTATKLEGPSGGEINGTAAQAAFIGSQAGINALLSRVGSSSSITSYTAGLESSENGKGFAGAGGVLSTGATFGDTGDLHNVNKGSKTTEQAYTQYINELRRSTLQAVQAATDIPKEMHDYLAQFDFNAMSDTAFDAVEKTFYSVLGLQEALVKLPFKQLKDLSFNAAAGLIAAADAMDTVADNGLETLGSLLSNYYDNFYSAGEKTANLTANTAASFAELGFTMPAVTTGLDDWYVGIMDATLAMDQSNPAVAQLTANLLGLGGSVATLGDTAASTQKLIDGIHTSATNTVWQMQYGMGTTQEQYGMWDVKIDDLDTQMRAATDINEIARFADEELKAIKSSWDLLSPDQQRASFGEYKQDIANVDAYVAQSGATPRDIQRADNQEFADIVATAVEKAMEKSAKAQQDAADAQAAAAANPTPIEVKVTVDTSASVEVDITRNGV